MTQCKSKKKTRTRAHPQAAKDRLEDEECELWQTIGRGGAPFALNFARVKEQKGKDGKKGNDGDQKGKPGKGAGLLW